MSAAGLPSITFASVYGEQVSSAFYGTMQKYSLYRQFEEMKRIGDALKECAGRLEDQELAKKYVEIADAKAFHSDVVNCQSGPLLSMGRGRICDAFLKETDNPWLFMCDTDQTFSPEVPEQMVWVAENARTHDGSKVLLLGGVVWMVTVFDDGTVAKKEPNVYRWVTDPRSGIEWMVKMAAEDLAAPGMYEVGGVGAGVMLIHRDLLIKVRDEACGGQPFWWHHLSAPGGDAALTAQVEAAAKNLGVDPMMLLNDQYGEDTSFCRRVAAVGEKVYVHSEPKFGHAKKIVQYGT